MVGWHRESEKEDVRDSQEYLEQSFEFFVS